MVKSTLLVALLGCSVSQKPRRTAPTTPHVEAAMPFSVHLERGRVSSSEGMRGIDLAPYAAIADALAGGENTVSLLAGRDFVIVDAIISIGNDDARLRFGGTSLSDLPSLDEIRRRREHLEQILRTERAWIPDHYDGPLILEGDAAAGVIERLEPSASELAPNATIMSSPTSVSVVATRPIDIRATALAEAKRRNRAFIVVVDNSFPSYGHRIFLDGHEDLVSFIRDVLREDLATMRFDLTPHTYSVELDGQRRTITVPDLYLPMR